MGEIRTKVGDGEFCQGCERLVERGGNAVCSLFGWVLTYFNTGPGAGLSPAMRCAQCLAAEVKPEPEPAPEAGKWVSAADAEAKPGMKARVDRSDTMAGWTGTLADPASRPMFLFGRVLCFTSKMPDRTNYHPDIMCSLWVPAESQPEPAPAPEPLKVGDWVRIAKPEKPTQGLSWNRDMDPLDGAIVQLSQACSDGDWLSEGTRAIATRGCGMWFLSPAWLTRVEAPEKADAEPTPDDTDLLSCPLCGCDDLDDYREPHQRQVGCPGCGLRAPAVRADGYDDDDAEAEADRQWNKLARRLAGR